MECPFLPLCLPTDPRGVKTNSYPLEEMLACLSPFLSREDDAEKHASSRGKANLRQIDLIASDPVFCIPHIYGLLSE
jgi:hypothetical protein